MNVAGDYIFGMAAVVCQRGMKPLANNPDFFNFFVCLFLLLLVFCVFVFRYLLPLFGNFIIIISLLYCVFVVLEPVSSYLVFELLHEIVTN
jgi:hypothetical protein